MFNFSEELMNEVFNYLNDWLLLNTGDSLVDRIPELFDNDGQYDEVVTFPTSQPPTPETSIGNYVTLED